MEASCWVARKIVRSVASASSSARTEPGRPILKATLVKGKITTSRMGTIGSRTMSAGVRSEYSSINQKCFSRTLEGTKGEPHESARPAHQGMILEHFATAPPLASGNKLTGGSPTVRGGGRRDVKLKEDEKRRRSHPPQ